MWACSSLTCDEGQAVVISEIPLLDLDSAGIDARSSGTMRRLAKPSVARDRAGAVLGQDDHLVPAFELGVGGDDAAAMVNPNLVAASLNLDGVTDQRKGHRIAVRVEADEEVLGDDAHEASFELEARPGGARHEMDQFLCESIEGPLVPHSPSDAATTRGSVTTNGRPNMVPIETPW